MRRPFAVRSGGLLGAAEVASWLEWLGSSFPIHRIKVSEDLLEMKYGTLYPALMRLEQSGWISSEWGNSDNNRRPRFYSITRQGRKQLALEAEGWEQMKAFITRMLGTTR
jgi:DNA-binding PadR family transcriptional regulator